MVKSAAIAIPLLASVTASHTMEFRIAHDPAENIQIIIGEGPIIDGDATRLETILTQAGRDRYGNIPLYLNSPGGSVGAAFAMVEVMDRHVVADWLPFNFGHIDH
jgi:ATP-dependent protease ClpP protease subunit